MCQCVPELVFLGVSREKPRGGKENTNNKLNPHSVSSPGFHPGHIGGTNTTVTPLFRRNLFSKSQTSSPQYLMNRKMD